MSNSMFYLVLLLLRIITFSRTRYWGKSSASDFANEGSLFPEGEYTFQFTLRGLTKDVPKAGGGNESVRGQSGSSESQHLIDT